MIFTFVTLFFDFLGFKRLDFRAPGELIFWQFLCSAGMGSCETRGRRHLSWSGCPCRAVPGTAVMGNQPGLGCWLLTLGPYEC